MGMSFPLLFNSPELLCVHVLCMYCICTVLVLCMYCACQCLSMYSVDSTITL